MSKSRENKLSASTREKNLLVGLDIGTSKVLAIVGEVTIEGKIEILGVGSHPSKGLKKGVVVNIDDTVKAIQKAVYEAEQMSGCKIQSVYTGIAGGHVGSFNSHGIVPIRDHEVSPFDIEHVIDAAKAVPISADQKTLHILPQEFIVDNQGGVKDPIGMSGVRLEVKVHIITGAVSAAQNIVKCVQRCNLEVDDIILEPLASSFAVLTEDEKQLGVCMIDIGGGTTDIALFTDGAIRDTFIIPIAGDQVTNDIAIATRTPTQSAENIKIQYGCALTRLTNIDELVEVPSVGDRALRRISRSTLAEVIEPRYEELFSLVKSELQKRGMIDYLGSGIVLTGGSARMEGVAELAEEVFNLPVRVGVPREVTGLIDVVKNPIYSTGVGLLIYGHQNLKQRRNDNTLNDGFKGFFTRMKSWFQGNF